MRWNREPFLQAACELIGEELDWDSLDAGRLHRAASSARTPEGEIIVVAVLDRAEMLPEVLGDAEAEQAGAPLWLYVPKGFDLADLDDCVVVRTVEGHEG